MTRRRLLTAYLWLSPQLLAWLILGIVSLRGLQGDTVRAAARDFGLHVHKAVWWIDRLSAENLELEMEWLEAAELELARAEAMTRVLSRSLNSRPGSASYSVPLAQLLSMYRQEIRELRRRVQEQGDASAEDWQVLRSTGDDLRAIGDVLTEEDWLNLAPARIVEKVASLAHDLEHPVGRGILGARE